MIVTKNTFVSYSLARGTVQFRLVLLILSLYTLLSFRLDNVTSEDLNPEVLSLGKFRLYAGVLIPLLDALLLLVNFFTDIVAFESMKYWASIMGLCIEFVLFYIVVSCYSALSVTAKIEVFCYI